MKPDLKTNSPLYGTMSSITNSLSGFVSNCSQEDLSCHIYKYGPINTISKHINGSKFISKAKPHIIFLSFHVYFAKEYMLHMVPIPKVIAAILKKNPESTNKSIVTQNHPTQPVIAGITVVHLP